MYNPYKLEEQYDQMEHGKARLSAIRQAIAEADENNDIPFRFYFRREYCKESVCYGDSLDMLVVFPQMLALADEYPDAPTTEYNDYFQKSVSDVLWVYKWIIGCCEKFYQIPMEDCLNYFEDFRRRYLESGYGLRSYYYRLYAFYCPIDTEKAEECFHQFESMSRDELSDCRACERNDVISFYLNKKNVKMADKLAADIDNFKLVCNVGDISAWLRMKCLYMKYYLREKEYATAEYYCHLVERNLNGETEYECWDAFLYCYAHTNIGKALKIYKEHWKEWLECRLPIDAFEINQNICFFLEKLGENRKGNTVKLPLDRSFPLYKENGQYKIKELYDFYYDRAKDIAQKFDERNGTRYFMDKLEGKEGYIL